MKPVLEFNCIVRSYVADTPVLDGGTFSFYQGEVVALLGRNGAGKTTLINIAMGLLRPDQGSVSVFGMSPFAEPVAVKRRIGYVSENLLLPGGASVAELISLHKRLFPEWDDQFEREMFERFQSLDRNRRIAHLSKGMAQQVALILAAAHRPELLIFDEPAGGLDPAARREFVEIAVQLLNREGTSVLFSTHQMGDVERLASRVVLLDEKQVKLDRDLDALREAQSLALIYKQHLVNAERLLALDDCLQVRNLGDRWHAVIRGTPPMVRVMLAEQLGIQSLDCKAVPLEELFIELVGDRRFSIGAAA